MPEFPEPDESNGFLSDHVRLLRSSLHKLTGVNLVDPAIGDIAAAQAVFEAPFVVMSHDTAADPVFNYANKAALSLFEMKWDQFTSLPSRYSAEAPNREERARLLAEVTAHGCIRNYAGIRVSSSGRRFRIDQAMVWNLIDEDNNPRGQAATFSHWKYL